MAACLFPQLVTTLCNMKVFIVLALIAVASCADVTDNSIISSADADELDELTATTLETFGGVVDDGGDSDTADGEDGVDLEESEPADDSDEKGDLVIYANFTEDGMIAVEDMIVSPEMFEVIFPPVPDHPDNGDAQTIHRRAAVSSSSKRWPSGRVPYAYHSGLLGSTSNVRKAMDEWEKYTCVKFEYRTSKETRYVQIRSRLNSKGVPENICSATLGYTGRLQYVNLGKYCFSHRTILHELGHVLGLIHEHQHPSRDSYVTIVWDNIEPIKKHNFNPKTGISSFGIKYDPMSIMHYRSTSFKKSGCKSPCYTIMSKLGSSTTSRMGTATHLSTRSDIPIIKKMYCNGKK